MAVSVRHKRIATAMVDTTLRELVTAVGVTYRIDSARLTSQSPSDETFSFWAPTGGAASAANLIAAADPIEADDSIEVKQLKGLVLEPGHSLWGQASADNVLTLVLSGVETTVS